MPAISVRMRTIYALNVYHDRGIYACNDLKFLNTVLVKNPLKNRKHKNFGPTKLLLQAY